jgi:hypothetical protein
MFLEQIESILHELSSHGYASTTTKIWEKIQPMEHIMHKDHHA